jgi:DnaK suppressor protein
MAHHTKTRSSARRQKQLRAILEARRRELMATVQGSMRDVRTREGVDREPIGDQEGPAFVGHQDVELALLQMKAQVLGNVDAALRRLDEGRYGRCTECGGEIAEARLSALPFAARCTACEQSRETARQARSGPQPRSSGGRLLDATE